MRKFVIKIIRNILQLANRASNFVSGYKMEIKLSSKNRKKVILFVSSNFPLQMSASETCYIVILKTSTASKLKKTVSW